MEDKRTCKKCGEDKCWNISLASGDRFTVEKLPEINFDVID